MLHIDAFDKQLGAVIIKNKTYILFIDENNQTTM